MKRISLAFFILAFCVTVLSACTPKDVKNLNENRIKSVTVSTLPELYERRLTGDEACAVVDYLSNLDLTPVLFEVGKGGMAWIISIEYENGDTARVTFFDKKVTVNGARYRMENEEALLFDKWLEDLCKGDNYKMKLNYIGILHS